MKKVLALLLILSCISGLVGCRDSVKENDDISNAPEQGMSHNEEIVSGMLVSKNLISGSGNTNGYYSLEPWGSYVNIMYTDYATSRQIVLCNRPACKHNDESCMGCEFETANTPSLLALQDKLVYIYAGNPYFYAERGKSVLPRIAISELDGSNKKTITTFNSNVKINVLDSVAFDEENLYIFIEIIEMQGDQAIQSLQLQQVNLTTGNLKLVVEFSDLSNQNFFFLGAAGGNFVFKRALAGVWDETLESNEQWDKFTSTQVAELFTINSRGEASDALLSYHFGEYTDKVVNGSIFLTDLKEKTLYKLDPETGRQEEIAANLPFDFTLLYGTPQICLEEWLIVDFIAIEGTKRYAVNMVTHEYKELTLSASIDGITMPYFIYDYIDETILIRVSTHMENFTNPMHDGSVINDTRLVEDRAIISANDFLNNINNLHLIGSY